VIGLDLSGWDWNEREGVWGCGGGGVKEEACQKKTKAKKHTHHKTMVRVASFCVRWVCFLGGSVRFHPFSPLTPVAAPPPCPWRPSIPSPPLTKQRKTRDDGNEGSPQGSKGPGGEEAREKGRNKRVKPPELVSTNTKFLIDRTTSPPLLLSRLPCWCGRHPHGTPSSRLPSFRARVACPCSPGGKEGAQHASIIYRAPSPPHAQSRPPRPPPSPRVVALLDQRKKI
jgi:hypothetical protein